MEILARMKNGLIVSCQALENEPLHSPFIMGRMARAAALGGASGIRANGFEDILEIKKQVALPVIGIIKKEYEGYEPYITPTVEEVRMIVEAGADIVAVDATKHVKPGGLTTAQFLKNIRLEFPDILVMADISTFDEGVEADILGFDLVSTTLSGYTDYSSKMDGPDFALVEKLSKAIKKPLIAEGRIWEPCEAAKALESGAFAVVVGTAITRPQEITRRFARAIMERGMQNQRS